MTSLPRQADAGTKVQKFCRIKSLKAKNLQKRIQKFGILDIYPYLCGVKGGTK
jgi:hypothetical protein